MNAKPPAKIGVFEKIALLVKWGSVGGGLAFANKTAFSDKIILF
jgi:hypothetical protein